MKQALHLLFLLFTLTTSFSASAETKTYSTQTAKLLYDSGDPIGSAEYYAKIGELLLRDRSIELSHQLFTQALGIDPKNIRANFYSAFTGIIIKTKGIKTRSALYNPSISIPNHDFFNEASDVTGEITQSTRTSIQSATARDSGWEIFFNSLEANSPITTNEDFRIYYLNEILPAFVEAKSKMNVLKNISSTYSTEFNVDLDDLLGRTPTHYQTRNCYYYSNGRYDCYDYDYNTSLGARKFYITEAILKAIEWDIDYYISSLEIGTTYRLTGFENMHAVVKRRIRTGQMSGPQQYKLWMSLFKTQPMFLTREGSLNKLDLKARFESMIQSAFEIQESGLCQSQSAHEQPFCEILKDTVGLNQARRIFSGSVNLVLGYDRRYQPVKVQLNLPGFLSNDPVDLKQLFPRTDDLETAPDATFAGLFPDRDFAKKLKTVKYSIDPIIE